MNMNRKYTEHRSTIFGWNANVVAVLTWWGATILSIIIDGNYLGFLVPLLILLLEKDSQLVRNHAGQAFALNIIIGVLSFVLSMVAVILTTTTAFIFPPLAFVTGGLMGLVGTVVAVISIGFSIVGSINGYRWESYYMPGFGGLGRFFTDKIKINN